MPIDPSPECFIDTNVWLYAFIESEDDQEREKGRIARSLIRNTQPVVSTQVVNEVCVNLLRQAAFSEERIRRLIDAFYQRYTVISLNKEILRLASYLRERYALSYWDSLIVAAGQKAGVPVLYSEDMQHGLLVEGRLEIRNPFHEMQ